MTGLLWIQIMLLYAKARFGLVYASLGFATASCGLQTYVFLVLWIKQKKQYGKTLVSQFHS